MYATTVDSALNEAQLLTSLMEPTTTQPMNANKRKHEEEITIASTPIITTKRTRTPIKPEIKPEFSSSARKITSSSRDHDAYDDEDDEDGKKKTNRRPVNRYSKGLRHFSLLVCDKLEKLKVSTYKQIADELVAENNEDRENAEREEGCSGYDEKNIRRRIYDALNVLMAMDIIGKEKKQIRWKGKNHELESMKQEHQHQQKLLAEQKELIATNIETKQKMLEELAYQYVGMKALIARNSNLQTPPPNKLDIPFLLVRSPEKAEVECEFSREHERVLLKYTTPFKIDSNETIVQQLAASYRNETELNNMLSHLPTDVRMILKHRIAHKQPEGKENQPQLMQRSQSDLTALQSAVASIESTPRQSLTRSSSTSPVSTSSSSSVDFPSLSAATSPSMNKLSPSFNFPLQSTSSTISPQSSDDEPLQQPARRLSHSSLIARNSPLTIQTSSPLLAATLKSSAAIPAISYTTITPAIALTLNNRAKI